MASFFRTLQDDIVARLLADSFFSDVPVLPEYLNDISNQVDRAVAQVGVVAVVATPKASVSAQSMNMPGPFYDDIKIIVRVTELVIVNNTGKSAHEIAETVVAMLHQWFPTGSSVAMAGDTDTITLSLKGQDEETGGGITGFDCKFKWQGGFVRPVTYAAMPIISLVGGVATLTCATPGAAIFWGLDSIPPSPGSGTLYLNPFTPTAGHILHAQAWLAGYVASQHALANT